jgi:hypothetical protein
MSDDTKRTGEAFPRINIQMRFVPEDKKKYVRETIVSVLGLLDNLKQITLPKIAMLPGSGKTFATNRYKLQTTIFDYKGWNGSEWFEKRMEIITQTFEEVALINFAVTQKKARKEFLDFYKESCNPREKPSDKDDAMLGKYDSYFLPWLKQEKVLFKLEYLDTASQDADATLKAYHNAINDYENGIFYYMGRILWTESTTSYRQHRKYFTNSIIKPYNMPIVEYDARMNEYAELLQYLPPPSKKNGKSGKAEWSKLNQLSQSEICEAIYDGLPTAYKHHIRDTYDP